jgi:4-amino-4-deoxy-L-arabinose transferase-like glycosyltransferase
MIGVLVVAAVLNLWGLGINVWANTYYSAAVRSMSASWHNFLFASMDPSGLMTVDKPPLALWVQALSVRLFGFHPLSILIPQALMGVVAAGLLYDLTRRRFGRTAGFAAGLALATTPVVVAVSRHNNPDELLVLCCVAALWFAVRALETGGTKWLVLSGVFVGLGFEAKMGVALMVVPGIAAAYLWVAPRGRLVALRQLVAGGASLAVVGLAWPVLVTLTPAADRPWISGTADNSVWSLIFSYNGVGRIAGQTGGPGGAAGPGGPGGTMFGGSTGVFRLLQSGLGDQAGWLLGFAVVAGLGVLVVSRLRRADPRTGWLIAVGGAFVTTALVFSFAQGIFHPYYVSFLAPFMAALAGAGVGLALERDLLSRAFAAAAVLAGAVTELVVLGSLSGQLSWAKPVVIVAATAGAGVLLLRLPGRVRLAGSAVALLLLLAAPATWATETLGHATGSTFPTGGPASAAGGPGGFGRHAGFGRRALGAAGFVPPGLSGRPGASAPGAGGSAAPGGFVAPGGFGAAPGASRGGAAGGATTAGGPGAAGAAGGPGGGMFGGDSAGLQAAIKYAQAHGGGTIGVESQSSAAAAIVSSHANVAGLGGFSGRESSVTARWAAMEVGDGHLRWVITSSGPGGVGPSRSGAARPGFSLQGLFGTSSGSAAAGAVRAAGFVPRGLGNSGATQRRFGGAADNRSGSQAALKVVAKTCRRVSLSGAVGSTTVMYDCRGRAAAILAAAGAS